jgi:hypothetical protein
MTHHPGMSGRALSSVRLAAAFAIVSAGAAASAESRQGRLFGTAEEALAVVGTFGADWRNPQEEAQTIDGRLRVRRFMYGKRHFALLHTDKRGIVRRFFVVDFTPRDPDDAIHPRLCSKLPDRDRLATLLLDAAEPNHTPKDLNLVKSAARIGWTPVHGQMGVKVNNTVFRFMSYSKKCAVEVGEYKPLPSV